MGFLHPFQKLGLGLGGGVNVGQAYNILIHTSILSRFKEMFCFKKGPMNDQPWEATELP